jgi:hypothetical protein
MIDAANLKKQVEARRNRREPESDPDDDQDPQIGY